MSSGWKLSFVMIAGALVVAIVGGFWRGSILGGFVALAAAVPAGYGIWKGTQEQSQWPMAKSIMALVLALVLAGLLFLLRLLAWLG